MQKIKSLGRVDKDEWVKSYSLKYSDNGKSWVNYNEDEELNGNHDGKKAVENITPAVEVKSRRVGGATFQIPTPIRDSRKRSLAIKWLIGFSQKRNEKTMSEKLAGEIMAAFKVDFVEGAMEQKYDKKMAINIFEFLYGSLSNIKPLMGLSFSSNLIS